MLFGLQQFSEGLVWLSFDHPAWEAWREPSTYAFLFFAQVIWPLWIPLSVWLMEPDRSRKKVLGYMLWLGGLTSAYMLYCLLAYEVSAVAQEGHIRYTLHFPALELRRVLYGLSTVIPLFVSSLRGMRILAAAILASFLISRFFYLHYVISVWCFFAAILSIMIYFTLVVNKRSAEVQR